MPSAASLRASVRLLMPSSFATAARRAFPWGKSKVIAFSIVTLSELSVRTAMRQGLVAILNQDFAQIRIRTNKMKVPLLCPGR